ncbi:GntR family transcriptional regulator [Gordonia sp. (in: high G+C Gram-positive bacteria)]|uniref:GntR family transcriptional regulator n=1 Tax=Gordonia sp. (in: high G+C Gram-positive bacteria) TaxID=84139 RepID=UPI003C792EA0
MRPRPQLSDDVAAYVRELIVSGQVKPGEFLRTEPIAQALGISNTPVREGLLHLQGEGFVHQVPRRGFAVSAFTAQDVRDLFWVQATLAAQLASRAAALITTEELDELEALNSERIAAGRSGDSNRMVKSGHDVHRGINLAARSPRLTIVLDQISRRLPSSFYADVEGHDEIDSAHDALVKALRAGDADEAGRLMHEHIMSGVDDLIDRLGEQGIFSTDEAAQP